MIACTMQMCIYFIIPINIYWRAMEGNTRAKCSRTLTYFCSQNDRKKCFFFSLNKVIGLQLFPSFLQKTRKNHYFLFFLPCFVQPIFLQKLSFFTNPLKVSVFLYNRQMSYKHAFIRFILKSGHFEVVNQINLQSPIGATHIHRQT